jgi:tRNA (mo5U34)-methyltransferase
MPRAVASSSVIERLGPWFHNLHLPDGRQTAPHHRLGDFPLFKWKQIAPYLPGKLKGWRALDIGCNAGFYSFELARRGATVTAIDIDAHYLRQARWAARQFRLEHGVEFRRMQVYELGRLDDKFDLVLFMGVFYHLRYPLLALDSVASCVRRLLVFQSLTIPGEEIYPGVDNHDIEDRDVLNEPGWPKLAFVEHKFAGDPTNWWIPNHACIEAILRSSGLSIVQRPGHEIYLCRPQRIKSAKWDKREFLSAIGRGRFQPGSGD